MPIYEYECPEHGRFERLIPLSLNEIAKKSVCIIEDSCLISCEKVWSLPAKMELSSPTIVFTNPQTGKAIVAINRYEKPPEGFVREELKSSIERSKFEHSQNAINAQEDEIYNETIRQKRSEFKKNHVEMIKSHMADDCAGSENPSASEALMKDAIKHIENKPLLKKKRKTEFVLDVNHKDRSNLG